MAGKVPQNLVPPSERQCLGLTQAGTRCKLWKWGGTEHCQTHQPDRVEARENLGKSDEEFEVIARLPSERQRELVLRRQLGISLGLVEDQVVAPTGKLVRKTPSIKDQNAAAATFLRYTGEERPDVEDMKPADIRRLFG